MNPESPKMIKGMIFIGENTLIMSDINFFIKYDLTTGEKTDELVIYMDSYEIYYLYNQDDEPRELFNVEELTYSYITELRNENEI